MTPPQRRQDPEVEAVLAAARVSRQEFLGQTEHMREAYADAILDDWERDSGLDSRDSED